MTRRETEETALRQSARDYGCAAGDFLQKSPKVVCAPVPEGARRYLEGTAFAMASYGHCVVARTEANVCGALAAFLQEREPRDCFVFPALGALIGLLSEHGIAALESGMYFLPDPGKMKEIPCFIRVILKTCTGRNGAMRSVRSAGNWIWSRWPRTTDRG